MVKNINTLGKPLENIWYVLYGMITIKNIANIFFLEDNKISFKAWYNNGQKKCEVYFLENKLHGQYKAWDIQGKIILSEDLVLGYRKNIF